MVQRNQVRDYLDVVALVDRLGDEAATRYLLGIDDYYTDRSEGEDSVLTALVQRLSEPAPCDARVTEQLSAYKGLDPRWHDWKTVVAGCRAIADSLLRAVEGSS